MDVFSELITARTCESEQYAEEVEGGGNVGDGIGLGAASVFVGKGVCVDVGGMTAVGVDVEGGGGGATHPHKITMQITQIYFFVVMFFPFFSPNHTPLCKYEPTCGTATFKLALQIQRPQCAG